MCAEHHSVAYNEGALTVALVDDEELIRRAVTQALAASGVVCVGEATSARAGVELVVGSRPDVVLIDLNLPDSNGVTAIEQLARMAPATRILILTRSEHNQVVEAIIAGASGYILKSATAEQIVAAVKATAAGETAISPPIATRLLQRVRERDIPVTSGSDSAASAIRAVLTRRELEIFTHLASGKNNQQIGEELDLSTNTVRNHIASILAKLHLDNRIQAAVQAVRSGIS
jgi:DNA-binding NarL/FixJ family response regulator